jgi:hypothetical protein
VDNYFLRLVLLAAFLIKLGGFIIFRLEQELIHPGLLSIITALVTCLSILVFVHLERKWRYLRPGQIFLAQKLYSVLARFWPKLAKKPLTAFKVADSSISFLTPIPLHAIKSVHNTSGNSRLIKHEYYQSISNLNLTVSCEYAQYHNESQPNIERMIEKRIQEYTEIDPAAGGKHIISLSFDHVGVETYILNGTFINSGEAYEYRAMYFQGGSRFWCIHTLFPARNKNGSTASIKLLNSVSFNFELPYQTIPDSNQLDWEGFSLDNGMLNFKTPVELFRHHGKVDLENRFKISHQEHYSSISNCNIVLECGFKLYHHSRKLTLDDAVNESLEFFADEYKVPAREVRLVRLTEFQIEGRWLQGSLQHNFHTCNFHQAVFTVGNHKWYIRLRYYNDFENGYEVFEHVLDSIRFDNGRLNEVINQMLDNYNSNS